MNEAERTLPPFGVVAEALTLAARHTGKLLLWASPLALIGLAAVGALALAPESALLAICVPVGFALVLVVYWAGFSVRVHRLILLPDPDPDPDSTLTQARQRDLGGSVRRSIAGLLLLALLAVAPTVCGFIAGVSILQAGLPGLWGPIVAFVTPYLAVMALLGKRQLLYLTDISLNGHASWKTSSAMARGFGWRLAAINALSGLFILGISLFAGWMVGSAFADGPQGLLEFLTVVVGLPAQIGFFACLQAACYGRLRLPSGPVAASSGPTA